MKYRIYRHPEGIGLNGKEFALDDKKDIMLFTTVKDAVQFLVKAVGKTVTRTQLEDNHGLHIEENIEEDDE
jgi:hypothetical protein|tara:strand:- start:596 stop:808 length:213 start_codon:yes stop_codon:yes gene_type:complete